MAKKRIYQLGLEAHYAANVLALWYEGKLKGDVRVRRARAEGLVVIETEDVELACQVNDSIGCRIVVKDIDV